MTLQQSITNAIYSQKECGCYILGFTYSLLKKADNVISLYKNKAKKRTLIKYWDFTAQDVNTIETQILELTAKSEHQF